MVKKKQVVVDSSFGSGINFSGQTIDLYTSTATGYFNDYKEVYVGQKNEGDWDDVTTFNLDGSNIHNYIGDYSKFYLQEVGTTSGFLLANNVFNGQNIYSNTIGDRSYNNTGRYWFVRNTIAGRFYNNTIQHNGFYSNNIDEYFDSNTIKNSVYENTIGQYFENNKINSEFYGNYIGNHFNQNDIYSDFYENRIGLNFYNNNISDYGNLNEFNFYRNVIGNDFNNNNIRQEFQNNQIGNQFHDNNTNGSFYKNVIGNGFNNNENIGYDFYGNHIGNGFNNNNNIGNTFSDNQIGEYFSGNNISYGFRNNKIGNQFQDNTLGNAQYFNWDNTSISNLTSRTYSTFRQALNNSIGNYILGTLLIMHDTVNNEYHRVIFTQWTQGGGGGFSYQRTKVYPTSGPTVYFTKSNYSSEVDVIVSGSLEITRGNGGGIYNAAVQGGWNNNAPQGTQWNSIYTQSNNNNGANFQNNVIGNYYSSNQIGTNFRYNSIGDNFTDNTIKEGFGFGYNSSQGNVIGNYCYANNIGEYFYNNRIADGFYSNTIGNYFQLNDIKTPVWTTNFNNYYGNIETLTYSVSGSTATDNSYTGVTGATNGDGVGATFDVVVTGGVPVSVTINNAGTLYEVNDTITIRGTAIGGTTPEDNIVVTVTSISQTPSVYENYNCNIFVRKGNNNRLSYYDESDVLTVETLTEAPCVGGLNALDVPENDLNFGLIL